MNKPTLRRALVVIDVQNEYFEGGGLPIEYPPTGQSLPKVTQAMDAASAAGIPVVVVRHHAAKGAPLFQADAHNGQLHPEVARRPHDHLVTKTFPSVFTGTDFADWIARERIDTLSLAGYMTHNCDAATAFEAMHRGLTVEFLADASGSLPYANAAGRASAEEIHRVFCVVFHSNFAAVTSTSDWIAAMQAGEAIAKDNVLLSSRRGRASETAPA
ncbi:MAG: cysteine hydrolase family protein [Polaromonas sp.]|uniref:cysteine hydrolase family protein n=1 Tax=Polaromonas sp. TaxID=1869339 RepID=UPI0024872DD7|nr:cysteine hydrolase family protein [Polaromonas sp.]MDI1238871.1 cysteine hydrolase family protein [Polaromonas sp.]